MARLTVEKAAVPRVTGKTETDYTYREISGSTAETNYTYSISVRQQSLEETYRPFEPSPYLYEGDDVQDHIYGDSSGETRAIDRLNKVVMHPEDVLGNVYDQVARIELLYGDGSVAVSSHWDSSDENFPPPPVLDPIKDERLGFYMGPKPEDITLGNISTIMHQSDHWTSACTRDEHGNNISCVKDAIQSVELEWENMRAVIYGGHDPNNPTMPLYADEKKIGSYSQKGVATNLPGIMAGSTLMSYMVKNFEITVSEVT